MSLTKEGVVKMVCEQFGVSRIESRHIVESFFTIIKDELRQGNEVLISSFGKWTAKAKKERRGRNPQTGDALTIAARRVVTFKPSLILKNKLNN